MERGAPETVPLSFFPVPRSELAAERLTTGPLTEIPPSLITS